MTRIRLLFLAAVLMALAALATACRDEVPAARTAPRPLAVQVALVQYGPISQSLYVEGTARAVRREFLYFQRPGRVIWVAPGPGGRELKPGDPVRKGQVLAKVDARLDRQRIATMEAYLAQAQSQARQAQRELARREKLFARGAVSRATLQEYRAAAESARAQVRAARAQLEQARLNPGFAVITSPIDGIIAYLNCRVGYYSQGPNIPARSESELLNLIPMVVVDPSSFEITVEVPYFQAGRVKVGQRAYLSLEPLPPPGSRIPRPEASPRQRLDQDPGDWWGRGRYIQAVVHSVSPAVDPGGRHVRVALRTRGAAPGLADGMPLSGWLVVQHRPRALLIPLEGTFTRDGRSYAWVVKEGRPRLVPLELGLSDDVAVEVIKGLQPGELVITKGRYLVTPAAPLKIAGPPHKLPPPTGGGEKDGP